MSGFRRGFRPSAAAAVLLFATLYSCDWERDSALVETSVLQHSFSALRRFSIRDPEDDSVVSYVERIRSAGDGERFAVDIQRWNGFALEDLSEDERLNVEGFEQHLDAGGGGHRVVHERDVRVHSAALARKNYDVVELSRPSFEAVVDDLQQAADSKLPESVSFLLLPKSADRPIHELTLSAEPGSMGFPLGYREYTLDAFGNRQLVSSMRVLELDFSAPGDIPERIDLIESREQLSDLDAVQRRADFPVYYPLAVPSGFELLSMDRLVMNTAATRTGELAPVPMIRMVFSDGIETLKIIQHKPSYGFSGPHSLVESVSPTLQVPLYRIGAVSCAIIIREDHQIVIESRTSTQRVHEMISSLKRIR